MTNEETIEKLYDLKLGAMAEAFREMLARPQDGGLSFPERLGLLVDREWLRREENRLARRLKAARLKVPASVEEVDFRTPRGLDRDVFVDLAAGGYLRHHHNVIITGATGLGKTYLACALADRALRDGFTAGYYRLPRLAFELALARADGSYLKILGQLAKVDLLILDDWGIAPLEGQAQHDLLEVIDDRTQSRSTLVASQVPVGEWHRLLADPTVADAVLDRLVHNAVRIDLKGGSMRKKRAGT
ncbi:MAG: IS21-like element helper ATPase IstB [Actinomycetota bacterium]|nr:IS21-like element helper ATPase IstB [Actinomycetota bacterium]